MKRISQSTWRTVVVSFIFLMIPSAFAGSIIRVLPGPIDGYRVQTPWEDYVVVQHGNAFWVGTQKEYDHAHAAAVFRDLGAKEIKVEGSKPNEFNFVSADTPSLAVGDNIINVIDIGILFGMGPDRKLHRPVKPSATEYVSTLWLQSKSTYTFAQVLDLETQKSYAAYNCSINEAFHACEFLMTRGVLNHKAAIIFLSKGAKPGLLATESIAKLAYERLLSQNKEAAQYKIDPSGEATSDLKHLHELDPNIPDSFSK